MERIYPISPLLEGMLTEIMTDPTFRSFRLVGGTNLALRFRHRESTDIDLFTDEMYGSLNFHTFHTWFHDRYKYVEPTDKSSKVGMGKTYYVGETQDEAIKVDLMYESEKFLFEPEIVNNIRMARTQEIGVMKLDAIYYGGRKKDFWDLHFLLIDQGFNLIDLIELHQKRFPYHHVREEMLERLYEFSNADEDPDPKCMLGKKWDMIKLDILDLLESI